VERVKHILRQTGLLTVMLAAFAGLAVSAYVHVNALFGRLPLGEATMSVHFWAVLLMAAAIIITIKMTKDERRQVDWGRLVRGAPRLVRWLVPVFFLYFAANFVNLAMTEQAVGRGKSPPVEVARMFSSGWLLIFTFALAVAWSQLSLAGEKRPRCPKGHAVGDDDDYCPSCGARIERA
jgi:hypothetical protein